MFLSLSGQWAAFCSETAGSSIEDKEFVIAVGNMIKGRAIPDNTPNIRRASALS